MKNGLQKHLKRKRQAPQGSGGERINAVFNVVHSKVETCHCSFPW